MIRTLPAFFFVTTIGLLCAIGCQRPADPTASEPPITVTQSDVNDQEQQDAEQADIEAAMAELDP